MRFLKVFIVSSVLFFIAFYLGANYYIMENTDLLEENSPFGFSNNIDNFSDSFLNRLEVEAKEPREFNSLEEAFLKSDRINFLILGMEDARTDTIILASLCPDSKKIHLISIPRDTYVHRKGYDDGEKRKINAVYFDHGIEGIKKTVSHVLAGIPIHHHVILDYEGVREIVDLIGGVEMDVPFHMKYKDPTSNPPLDIDIRPGRQILDGEKALDFIRYRKGNNKMGYVDGDLGRIRAQQEFLKAFLSKVKDNIITLITKGLRYVETDVGLLDALSYGRKVIGISTEDLEFHLLPGNSDFKKVNRRFYSYYVYREDEIKGLLEEIYNVKSNIIHEDNSN
ncbi:MAG: LytR family transcriptional regulator [Tissierellia bacterium]|nr:LytR family transcriptional regulator [Tissierellia bacterium]